VAEGQSRPQNDRRHSGGKGPLTGTIKARARLASKLILCTLRNCPIDHTDLKLYIIFACRRIPADP